MSRMLIVSVASLFLAYSSVAAGEDFSATIPPAVPESATPLPPRGTNTTSTPASKHNAKVSSTMTTVVGGLAVCLGLFFLVVWVTKRNSTNGSAVLPVEVVEPLGRAPVIWSATIAAAARGPQAGAFERYSNERRDDYGNHRSNGSRTVAGLLPATQSQ